MPVQRCCITGLEFDISERELAHLERMGNMRGMLGAEHLPLPSIHPLEDLRQFYCFGNLLYVYRGVSAFSGKTQLSRYNPLLGYQICTLEEFNNEDIDNLEFGMSYDFSRPFFEQWDELMHQVYLPPLNNANTEGSDYVNGADNAKDCYLCFSVIHSQDCMYCVNQYYGNDNVLCVGTMRCQYCYGCVEVDSCYECQHCRDCSNCNNCFGCEDCIGCSDCIGCIGLRNARHHIFNQEYSEKEFKRAAENWSRGSISERETLLNRCEAFHDQCGRQHSHFTNAENCSGNYVRNSKNIEQSFFCSDSQDCGYIMLGLKANDCWHGFSSHSELQWKAGGVGSQNLAFCYSVFYGESCLYCYHIYQHCDHCFGCVGLRRKSYCILNKQYTKEEFNELLPRIILHMKSTGEWGRFFDVKYAPFFYEESVAADFFEPLGLRELMQRGYRIEGVKKEALPQREATASDVPIDIRDITVSEWAGKSIVCRETGNTFNLQQRELEYYKRHNIPIPRIHWRHSLRKFLHSRGQVAAP